MTTCPLGNRENNIQSPPGRICGRRKKVEAKTPWETSPVAGMRTSGSPPAEGTRAIPTPGMLSKIMSSASQLAPKYGTMLAIGTGAPPRSETLLSCASDQKAIDCPSGEKNRLQGPFRSSDGGKHWLIHSPGRRAGLGRRRPRVSRRRHRQPVVEYDTKKRVRWQRSLKAYDRWRVR